MLFDDRKRTFFLLPRWAEPDFTFLDRSAHPTETRVRALMNKWYTEYPKSARADLMGRFRSKDHGQHLGALNELFLHAMFRHLGYEIDVAPAGSCNVSRPDFLLTRDAMPSFDLEATVAEVSDDERKRLRRAGELYDIIDRIDSSDFMLAVKSWSGPGTDLQYRRLRSELQRWLKVLDADSIPPAHQLDDLPTYDFCHDGWRIQFWAVPAQSECQDLDDRTIGIRFTGMHRLDSAGHIRRALEDKTTKYGARDRPFVIAVGVVADNPFPGSKALRIALFGHNTAIMDHRGKFVESRREGSGILWHCGTPRNTRVSGVILVPRLDAWNISTRKPIYIENPWAARPLLDIPLVFDRWFGSKTDPASIHRPPEVELHQLFGLPENWPQGDDDIDCQGSAQETARA